MQLTTYLPQVPAEAQDGSEVTADDARAYPISDGAASSLRDDAAGEDNSQHVATVAGSSQTSQEYVTILIAPTAN